MRRVLFDEDMPRQLRRELSEFEIHTVQEEGWAGLKNGELLRQAEARFDVLLTADQRLPHQQNVSRFDLGIVVIAARDTRLPHLWTLVPQLRAALASVAAGSVVVVKSFKSTS